MAFSKVGLIKNNFIDFSLMDYDSSYYINYEIPLKFAHRPDIISYSLYRDVTYQNLLSYINRIDNSPEGYYTGRILKVIDPERINSIWKA